MENIVFLVHIVIALGIIGLILMQQGKGAEMGASFGSGASQTLFGASGSGNFFSRMTAILAALFFATSFGLAIIAKENSQVQDAIPLPSLETVAPPTGSAEEAGEIPSVDDVDSAVPSAESLESDVPSGAEEASSEGVDVPAPEGSGS